MSKKVQPFSNLTDFIKWKYKNCDKCCRYENKSTKANNARCRLAFYLDLASVTDGMISVTTALKIGTTEFNGIHSTCTLKYSCNNFNKPIIRKKYNKEIKGQIKLFP